MNHFLLFVGFFLQDLRPSLSMILKTENHFRWEFEFSPLQQQSNAECLASSGVNAHALCLFNHQSFETKALLTLTEALVRHREDWHWAGERECKLRALTTRKILQKPQNWWGKVTWPSLHEQYSNTDNDYKSHANIKSYIFKTSRKPQYLWWCNSEVQKMTYWMLLH